MKERSLWSRDDLHGGIIVFHSITTAAGTLLSVYLGPGGAFVYMAFCEDPQDVCNALKDILRTTRLQLCTTDQGLYDPSANDFSDPLSEDEVQEYAINFVDGSEVWLGYTQDDLERMSQRLISADAYSRGWYQSPDGREYKLCGKGFQELSDLDPNTLFYMTLFGGTLGVHCFHLGKNLTGFLYLFTGGLAMLGWLTDLVFLLLGFQRDKQKRLVNKPSHRLAKLLLLPVGFGVNCIILLAMRTIISGFLPS